MVRKKIHFICVCDFLSEDILHHTILQLRLGTLPAREHGSPTRVLDWIGRPCLRAVFTGAGPHYRQRRPSRRPVNTGSVDEAQVSTGHVDKKHCTTMLFANMARPNVCSVHTTRVHGPSTRPCSRYHVGHP